LVPIWSIPYPNFRHRTLKANVAKQQVPAGDIDDDFKQGFQLSSTPCEWIASAVYGAVALN
jgi:hypothetical protein